MMNNSKTINLITIHEYQLNTIALLNVINEKQSKFLHLNDDDFDNDIRPENVDLYSIEEIKKREQLTKEYYYEVSSLNEVLKERLENFYNLASEVVQNSINDFTKDYAETHRKYNIKIA